ncbi:hypothetical protein [Corynebacterium bovis]
MSTTTNTAPITRAALPMPLMSTEMAISEQTQYNKHEPMAMIR